MPSSRPSPRGSRPTSRNDHPLANLPRPLSERERRSRLPRVLALGVVGIVSAGIFAAATSSPAGGPLAPVGAVQGAVTTPKPSDAGPAVPRPTEQPKPAAVATPPAVPTATPAPTPIPPALLTGYQWPLPKGRLTLPFGPSPWGSRVVEGELFHDGVDLATFCGDRIVAAHDGTVIAAGRHYDGVMGWVGDLQPYLDRLEKKHLFGTLPIVVVIDDGNGYRSVYAHFGKIKVKKRDTVKAGQLLGWEGATGRASGCHLHYGLFSPLETATFGIDKDVVKRMKVPDKQIARIDPLLVLPERPKPTKAPPSDAASPSP